MRRFLFLVFLVLPIFLWADIEIKSAKDILHGGEEVELTVEGGVPPYIWVVDSGEVEYEVEDGSRVKLTAPNISGNFTVRVIDSKGESGERVFFVRWEGFFVSPQYVYLEPGERVRIFFYNQVGDVEVYSDGGSWSYIDRGIEYQAPDSPGLYSIVFRDGEGTIRYCHVKVYSALSISSSIPIERVEDGYEVKIKDDSPIFFRVSGGVPPYLWVAGGKGEIDKIMGDSVWYTPGDLKGEDSIKVYDSAGNALTIHIYYAGPLLCNIMKHTVETGEKVTFSAVGGSPPYRISLPSQGGYEVISQSNSSKTVVFIEPGEYETVISDSMGSISICRVKVVGSGLTIEPSGTLRIRPRKDGTIQPVTITAKGYTGLPLWICQGPCSQDSFTPSDRGTMVVFHPPSEGIYRILAEDDVGSRDELLVIVYRDIYNYYAGEDGRLDEKEMEEAIDDLFSGRTSFQMSEFYYLIERFLSSE